MIPASLTLVFLIIFAPTVIFALGFLQTGPAIAAGVLALAVPILVARRTDWRGRPDVTLLAVSLGVAGALTLFSGIGHVFWQTDDWMVRDAMLFDLARRAWPVSYVLGDSDGLLRAPIGMYLLPALVGKFAGLAGAEAALFLQNATLLGLCIYIFARALPPGRTQYVAVLIFVAFSGLDSLAWIMRRAALADLFLVHLEPWPGFFQYSSHITQIFWTPHHGLAGWAIVAGYLVWRQGQISALTIGPLWVASIFWSPLAAIGAIPFLAFAFLCDVVDGRLRAVDFGLAALATLAVLPTVFFVTRDTGGIVKGPMDFSEMPVVTNYFSLLMVEVAPWFAIAWQGRNVSDRRGLYELLLIVGVLCAIPTYKLGYANDFAMRVSIVGLALLCFRAVSPLMSLGNEPASRRAIIVGFVVAGAMTPATEIFRNIVQPATPASACNVPESLQDGPYAGSPLDYYIARRASFSDWFFKAPTEAPLSRTITNCWPGRRFVYGPPSPK